MKVNVYIALSIILGAGQVFAGATFYTGPNCSMGKRFSRSSAYIKSLKNIKYTYPCTKTRNVGPDGDVSLDFKTTCSKSFNDDITSVRLTGETSVIIYEHSNYRGNSEVLDESGCWSLGWINNRASSIVIRP